MQRTGASLIAALILLLLAIALQIPEIRDMAIVHRARDLLRQSAPLVNHSIRRVLPHHHHSNNNIHHPFLATSSLSPSHSPTTSHHRQSSSSSSTNMADSKGLLDAIESRRSIHQLTNESTIPDARIKELITHVVKHVPSSFNSQTTRLVVVLKEKHEELWDAIMEVYKVQLPADKFEQAKGRMTMFRKAYGTVSSSTLFLFSFFWFFLLYHFKPLPFFPQKINHCFVPSFNWLLMKTTTTMMMMYMYDC